MFIDERVKHKVFGFGYITDISMDDTDIFNSILTVEFDSGETKRISMAAMGSRLGLMESEDIDTMEFVRGIESESVNKRKEKVSNVISEWKLNDKKESEIIKYDYDEYEKEVTIADWDKAYSVAGDYRFPGESRAVIVDTGMVFINASSGCRYFGGRCKDADKLYKVCESNEKHLGHKWRYATKEEIKKVMEFEVTDDTK